MSSQPIPFLAIFVRTLFQFNQQLPTGTDEKFILQWIIVFPIEKNNFLNVFKIVNIDLIHDETLLKLMLIIPTAIMNVEQKLPFFIINQKFLFTLRGYTTPEFSKDEKNY